jgi:hypothetical protein
MGVSDLNVAQFKVLILLYFLDSSKFSLNHIVCCNTNVCLLKFVVTCITLSLSLSIYIYIYKSNEMQN